jgi:hypothetical protein
MYVHVCARQRGIGAGTGRGDTDPNGTYAKSRTKMMAAKTPPMSLIFIQARPWETRSSSSAV